MFEPVVIYSAEAKYRDLLREAERERQVKQARRLGVLASILIALGVLGR